jgi:hypothetical protein
MVNAVLLKPLCAVGLFLLGIMLAMAGWHYFTNAETLCQRYAEGAEKMPRILQLLSPPRFFRSRYALWQLRSSGVASIVMGCVLVIIALLTLFTHQ